MQEELFSVVVAAGLQREVTKYIYSCTVQFGDAYSLSVSALCFFELQL